MLAEKDAHGDARVSFGGNEKPQYRALADAIQGFYRDLLRPLDELEEAVFKALPALPTTKAEERFRYTAIAHDVIDKALEIFLAEMAGPDRSREGFVEGGLASDQSDGVIQQRLQHTFAIGVERGAEVIGRGTTIAAGRQSPAVMAMMESAFARLSESGKLRLEGVRDDIHGILTSATAAGLSPLETARQLSGQFDNYRRYQFERLARTEAAFAAEAGSRAQYRDLGVRYLKILLAANACPICRTFEERLIAIDDLDSQPPYHPNCLCTTIPA